jgi:hypothetical protein
VHLFFGKRIAEGRHLILAVENTLGNLFVGPVLLFADFGKGGGFFGAFEVRAVTADAVVAEKNGTRLFIGLGIRGLPGNGYNGSKKKDKENS